MSANSYEDVRIKETINLLEKYQNKNDRISFAIAPHAAYTCNKKSLEICVELAKKYKLPIHIHLAETKDEVNIIKEKYNVSPTIFLKQMGILDVPVIFPYAPNALLIGFIVAMITSIITLLLTSGMFPTVVIPLISTCFFESGCAAIIGNAKGGVRGCIIGAAACGIVMVFLVGFGAYFFNNTIQQWMLVYGGQDFSLWGIVEGFIARLIA